MGHIIFLSVALTLKCAQISSGGGVKNIGYKSLPPIPRGIDVSQWPGICIFNKDPSLSDEKYLSSTNTDLEDRRENFLRSVLGGRTGEYTDALFKCYFSTTIMNSEECICLFHKYLLNFR